MPGKFHEWKSLVGYSTWGHICIHIWNLSWESLLVCRTEMVSQDKNFLPQLILCDSNYLLPMPLVLTDRQLVKRKEEKKRLTVEGICFRNRKNGKTLLPSCWEMTAGLWDPGFVTPFHSGWLWRQRGYENTLIIQEIFCSYTHEYNQWIWEPADNWWIFFLTHGKVSWSVLRGIFQFLKKESLQNFILLLFQGKTMSYKSTCRLLKTY